MTALICAYDITSDRAAVPVPAEHLTGPIPDGAWRWVHLLRTEPDVEETLGALGLPEATVEAMTVEETRPRTWTQGPRTLLVLRGVNLNEDVGEHPLISLRLCLSERMVVTCRKFRFRALEDLVNRCDTGDAPPTPAAFVVDLVDGLSIRFANRIVDLDDMLEAIEDEDGHDREERLTVLRRDLVPLGRFMAPQREALHRLSSTPPAWVSASDREAMADTENEFTRLIEHLRELEVRALLLKEELASETAAIQARNTYLISILAALFVPLSFITGLLGMNVAGIPGADTPYAFALVVALMAAGFFAGVGILKWRGWI
ncbi:MAG: CorA family divalent cation transporter [Thalassobaculaceae bacterium]|nr:CorA family divalent cation transporter [Thalassobaculaceae bacterium]